VLEASGPDVGSARPGRSDMHATCNRDRDRGRLAVNDHAWSECDGQLGRDGAAQVYRGLERVPPDARWPVVQDLARHLLLDAVTESPLPLSALRFGYFDHDRIMDVIAVENGRWAVS
jgi:hypothetical protein